MNTKHTPGPWTVGHFNDVRSNDGYHSIANVSSAFELPAKANARLIAAAPELLEALQTLSETAGRIAQGAAVIDERGFNTLAHSISVALAAIAKATNQQ